VGALSASIFLGHRNNIKHNPASIPNVLLGTAILWFGWFGYTLNINIIIYSIQYNSTAPIPYIHRFNAGCVNAANALTGHVFMTTNTAAGASMVTWILIDTYYKKPNSSIGACNGIIVGLVAITPGCAYVTTGASIFIGSLASIVCYHVGAYMKESMLVDDALEVFPIHGLTLLSLTSIFAQLRRIYNNNNDRCCGNQRCNSYEHVLQRASES